MRGNVAQGKLEEEEEEGEEEEKEGGEEDEEGEGEGGGPRRIRRRRRKEWTGSSRWVWLSSHMLHQGLDQQLSSSVSRSEVTIYRELMLGA